MKFAILIIDDEETIQALYRRHLGLAGFDVTSTGTIAGARDEIQQRRFDAILLDLNLPDGRGLEFLPELRGAQPSAAIVVITVHNEVSIAVQAMQQGADNFLAKPIDMEALKVYLRKGIELGTMRRGQMSRRRTVKLLEPYFGDAPASRDVFALASNAAQNDSAVMIYGETGVGKGVLARWIHEHSSRAAMPFVEVNCSSLRGELLSSELFGHARGAFTSAVDDRQGLIEIADGGTLFLDEIGDMDVVVQAQFLKVIEEKRYRRLGEVRMRTSEFRLLCATNQLLDQRVSSGAFRRDLFFRINVFPITVPPLRAVPENIPGLVQSLVKFLTSREVVVEPGVFELLARYQWPGNVRELRNVIERALVLGNGRLKPEHFYLLNQPASEAQANAPSASLNLVDMEYARIREAMTRFKGDTKLAAEALGISRATLYRRLSDMKKS